MIYKIKDRNTGKYATGDMWPLSAWSNTGKLYKQKAYAIKSVYMIIDQYDHTTAKLKKYVPYPRPKIVIEEYNLVPTGTKIEVI